MVHSFVLSHHNTDVSVQSDEDYVGHKGTLLFSHNREKEDETIYITVQQNKAKNNNIQFRWWKTSLFEISYEEKFSSFLLIFQSKPNYG